MNPKNGVSSKNPKKKKIKKKKIKRSILKNSKKVHIHNLDYLNLYKDK